MRNSSYTLALLRFGLLSLLRSLAVSTWVGFGAADHCALLVRFLGRTAHSTVKHPSEITSALGASRPCASGLVDSLISSQILSSAVLPLSRVSSFLIHFR